MPHEDHDQNLTLRLQPPGDTNEVPAELLAQTLVGFQQLVCLCALQVEGYAVRQRVRIPDQVRDRFVLACRPPKPGSFLVEARIMQRTPDVVSASRVPEVVKKLRDFSTAASAGDTNAVNDLVPDSRLRRKMLSCLGGLAPPTGSGYRFGFSNGVGGEVVLSEDVSRKVETLIRPVDDTEAVRTVTGKLDAISFSEHKLTLFYAPKSRLLDCIYDDDLEPMLFENRRDLIQVTGRVLMDEEQHPKKIVEVEAIEDLDLTSFAISEVNWGSGILRFHEALAIKPSLDESEQLLQVEYPDLGIDAFAPTRTELYEEILDQIRMLWIEYAEETDENLSAPALNLKHRLTQAIIKEG